MKPGFAVSDHFDGKLFFNPDLPSSALPRFTDAFKMVREPRATWPTWVENSATPSLGEALRRDEVALTFVNHATFLIQTAGLNILTDPVWSDRVSPVQWAGPKRVRPPGVQFDQLPKIDGILLSHNHYDHLDSATLRRLSAACAPKVFVPLGVAPLVRSLGLTDVIELDWWQTADIASGVRVSFAPAQHQGNRGLFDRLKSLWGSYMLDTGDRRVYYGADSGYSRHFTQIRERLGAPDLSLLGIGAYEPRWFMRPIHMNPAEAVSAHRDLGSRLSVGMHFGTFQLSSEGFDQPKHDLIAALAAAQMPEADFLTLSEGETRVFGR